MNLGSSDAASPSTVSYTPPTGIELDLANLPATCSAADVAGPATCSVDPLVDQATAQLVIPVAAPAEAAPSTNFADGTVTVTNVDDPTPANNTAASAIDTAPSISNLTTTIADPGPVVPGEVTLVTMTVLNAGPSDALNAFGLYTPPPGVTVDGASLPTGCSIAPDTVSALCDLGTIADDGSVAVDIPVIVGSDVAPSSTLTGTTTGAYSASADPDGDTVATDLSTGPAEADIDIVVTAPAPIAPGTSGVLTIEVTNDGPSDTDEPTTVVYTPPSGSTVDVSALPAGCVADTPSVGSFTCTVAPLVDGAMQSLAFTIDVPADAPTMTTLSGGTVTATNNDDPAAGNNTVSSDIDTAAGTSDLSTVVSDPGPITPGLFATVNLTTTNDGPSDAPSSSVVYTPPVGVALDMMSLPVGCVADLPNPGSTTCDLGTIVPLGSASVDLPVMVDSAANASSTLPGGIAGATSLSDDPDGDAIVPALTAGPGVADLVVDVSDPGPLTPGTGSDVVVTIDNLGPSLAETNTVIYTPPAGVSVDMAALPIGCAADTPTAGSVTCSIADLDTGEQAVLAIPVIAAADAPASSTLGGGTLDVTSLVTDPVPANSTAVASEVTTGVGEADLQLDVLAVPTLEPGATGTIDLTVTNNGPSEAGSVEVNFTLPAGVELDPAHANPDACIDVDGLVTCVLTGPIGNGAVVPVTIPVMMLLEQPTSGPLDPSDVALVNPSVLDPNTANDTGAGSPVLDLSGDADGDGIPDFLEIDPLGTGTPADTDGDLIPDYLDLDSDGDGIPDANEVGADPLAPVDTDGDLIPDHLDVDSDGDGIPDALEVGADPLAPVDTDGDLIPDHLDVDSDGDGIVDGLEAGADPANPLDSNADGIPDFQSLDSDGDGIDDAAEAGSDLSAPVDTDGDGIPNFQDPDSDGDGITDAEEVDNGLDTDFDGDGIPDWLDPIGFTISGQVFVDSNRNGVLDLGENDLSGVDVQLLAAGVDGVLGTADDVVIRTATTASPYTFVDVPDGEFLVKVDPATLPAGVFATDDVDLGSDQAVVVSVEGADVVAQHFGQNYAAVSGIFTDASGAPIANAELTVMDAEGNLFTTTTAADGSYFVEGSAANTLALGEATVTAVVNGTTVMRSVAVAGAQVASVDLEAPPVSSSGPAALAFTGSNLWPMVTVALGLIVVGTTMVIPERRASRVPSGRR